MAALKEKTSASEAIEAIEGPPENQPLPCFFPPKTVSTRVGRPTKTCNNQKRSGCPVGFPFQARKTNRFAPCFPVSLLGYQPKNIQARHVFRWVLTLLPTKNEDLVPTESPPAAPVPAAEAPSATSGVHRPKAQNHTKATVSTGFSGGSHRKKKKEKKKKNA